MTPPGDVAERSSSTQICVPLFSPEELSRYSTLAEAGPAIIAKKAALNAMYQAALRGIAELVAEAGSDGLADVLRDGLKTVWMPAGSDSNTSAAVTRRTAAARTDVPLRGADFGTHARISSVAKTTAAIQDLEPQSEPQPEPEPQPQPQTVGLPGDIRSAADEARDGIALDSPTDSGPREEIPSGIETRPADERPSMQELAADGVRWAETKAPHTSLAAVTAAATEDLEAFQAALAGLAEAGFPEPGSSSARAGFSISLDSESGPLANGVRERLTELEEGSMGGPLAEKESAEFTQLMNAIAQKFKDMIDMRADETFNGFVADDDPKHIITDMRIVHKVAELATRQLVLAYKNHPSDTHLQVMNICPPADIDCGPS